ncbi:condensation domain-containing protein [Nocardiopsis alba]|uniref:condensation domain-containing protein n=1 Tax=Nocardiopsis alba TaxID=53437 RepID=UPI0035DCE2EA
MPSDPRPSAPLDSPSTLPLAHEQEFLLLQHDEDGSSSGFGPRPVSSGGWRLRGPIDLDALRGAMGDVVEWHEPLRTALLAENGRIRQKVHPAYEPEPEVSDLSAVDEHDRDTAAEDFLNRSEALVFDEDGPPWIRVHLGRFDATDAVLSIVARQPQVDVWSVHLILRDLMAFYGARRGEDGSGPRRGPGYREYVSHQRSSTDVEARDASFDYWSTRLSGARPIVVPADRPPSGGEAMGTRRQRFTVDAELGLRTTDLAKSMRCSPFMVLFSVYLIHLGRSTGEWDGVVWTLTPGPGRRRRRWEDTVGYFVNMMPLRADISHCRTFREVVERVRSACIEAYPHEVPFVRLVAEAPEVMGALEQGGMVVPGFQMSPHEFTLGRHSAAGLDCVPVRRRLSQDLAPDVPDDAILWTMEVSPEGELLGAVNSSVERFEESTIEAMTTAFTRLLRCAVDAPDAPLDHV